MTVAAAHVTVGLEPTTRSAMPDHRAATQTAPADTRQQILRFQASCWAAPHLTGVVPQVRLGCCGQSCVCSGPLVVADDSPRWLIDARPFSLGPGRALSLTP